MSDTIRTPADALEAAARVAYFQMMKEPLCSAVSVAASIRALAPRIAAPDDEALVKIIRCALYDSDPLLMQVYKPAEREAMTRAVLDALREAGALR